MKIWYVKMIGPVLHAAVRVIVAAWTLLAAITASADKFNFDNKSGYVIYDAKAKVQDRVLRIDTRSTANRWNVCFKTRPGYFQPGKTYRVKVDCRVKNIEKDGYLLLLLRPFERNNGSYDDIASRIVTDAKERNAISFPLFVPEDRTDYVFQVHTHGGLTAEIKNLEFEELPAKIGARATATQLQPPASGGLPDLPEGARDFTVESPALQSHRAIAAADYGVSTASKDNTAALQRAIDVCAKSAGNRLILAPGRYYFSSSSPLRFDKLKDFEFDGQGATLVYWNKRILFEIRNCERTTFRNFKVDWNWEQDPLCSTVRVENIEKNGRWVDFRFIDYRKLPRRDLPIVMLDLLDPVTRSVGHRKSFNIIFPPELRRRPRQWPEPDLLRFDRYDFKGQLKVGQIFRMPHYYYGNGAKAFSLENNAQQTFADIRIFSCLGSAIVVKGLQRYWQLLRVDILPPPGDRSRAITCTADHLHMVNSRGFFKMESCDFGYGNDDCVNIHDVSVWTERSGARKIRTRNLRPGPARSFHRGDFIELRNADYSPTGFQATLAGIEPVDPAAGIYELSFERDLPALRDLGWVVFNRRYDSRNIMIRHCRFHDNRGRGLLLLARDVTVENCEFARHQTGAIHIETGYTMDRWSEGFGASNIVIRDNVFRLVNPKGRYVYEMRPDIYISTYLEVDPSTVKTSYPILENILIARNRFYDSTGAVVYLASTGRAFLLDNVIDGRSCSGPKYDYQGVIGLECAADIWIQGNRWQGGDGRRPGVKYDPSTTRNLYLGENKIE